MQPCFWTFVNVFATGAILWQFVSLWTFTMKWTGCIDTSTTSTKTRSFFTFINIHAYLEWQVLKNCHQNFLKLSSKLSIKLSWNYPQIFPEWFQKLSQKLFWNYPKICSWIVPEIVPEIFHKITCIMGVTSNPGSHWQVKLPGTSMQVPFPQTSVKIEHSSILLQVIPCSSKAYPWFRLVKEWVETNPKKLFTFADIPHRSWWYVGKGGSVEERLYGKTSLYSISFSRSMISLGVKNYQIDWLFEVNFCHKKPKVTRH